MLGEDDATILVPIAESEAINEKPDKRNTLVEPICVLIADKAVPMVNPASPGKVDAKDCTLIDDNAHPTVKPKTRGAVVVDLAVNPADKDTPEVNPAKGIFTSEGGGGGPGGAGGGCGFGFVSSAGGAGDGIGVGIAWLNGVETTHAPLMKPYHWAVFASWT